MGKGRGWDEGVVREGRGGTNEREEKEGGGEGWRGRESNVSEERHVTESDNPERFFFNHLLLICTRKTFCFFHELTDKQKSSVCN